MSKEPAGKAATNGDQGVDAIREVLLGDRLRMYEQRFELLDKTVQSEREALRDSFEQRLAQLESSVREHISQVEGDLQSEQKARAEEVKSITLRLDQASNTLREQIEKVGTDHQTFKGESQRELLALSKNLFKELQDNCANLNAYVERESSHLSNEMATRSSVANALQAMAASLCPEGEDEGDADKGKSK